MPPQLEQSAGGSSVGPPASGDHLDIRNVTGTVSTVCPVSLERGLVVTSSLLAGADNKIVVLVRNGGQRPRTLRQGKCLLRLNVESTAPVNNVDAGADRPDLQPGKLPEALETLLADCTELTTTQQQKAREVISEFQATFSCYGEIGNCPLVEHHIDTGNSAPIKQAPRRLAFGKEQQAEASITDMLEKRVIGYLINRKGILADPKKTEKKLARTLR